MHGLQRNNDYCFFSEHIMRVVDILQYSIIFAEKVEFIMMRGKVVTVFLSSLVMCKYIIILFVDRKRCV